MGAFIGQSIDNRPQITPIDRGIRVERWIANSPGPAGRQAEGRADVWSSYDFLVPSPRIMPTVHDKGVTLCNRLVERLAGKAP